MKDLMKIFDKIDVICNRYGEKIFVGIVCFCCIYVLGVSYFNGVYISLDSASYLREAENLYHGYGYNDNGLAGGDGWFSLFPILYPFLICCIMKLTACNAYLSSKILACITMVALAVVVKRNTKNPVLFAPIFLNFGFIWCHLITLSESLFMLFVSLSVFVLNKVQMENEHVFRHGLELLFFCICAFLTRYFGLFLAFLLLFLGGADLLKWQKRKERELLKKGIILWGVDLLFGGLCAVYFYINNSMSGFSSGGERFVFVEKYSDLTLDLIRALLDEIYGLFGNVIHGLINVSGTSVIIDCITIVGLVFLFFKCFRAGVRFNKFSELTKTFLIAGVMYYVVFIVYRYTSTMNHFYYRFLVPGSILFLIACINQLSLSKLKYLHLIVCTICAVLVISNAILGLTYYRGPGYKEMVQRWNKDYQLIEPYSLLLFSYSSVEFEPSLIWLRPDVFLFRITDSISWADLVKEYPNRSIYLDKNCLKTMDSVNLNVDIKEKIKGAIESNGLLLLQK